MERASQIKKLSDKGKIWDMVVVGGGATGLGVAVDAATRGMSVACLEKTDFAKCTSSRSTKLVHGGVRYLQKGDVMLVLEALRERGRMKANAPHLVKDQAFVISNYRYWDNFLYFCGLTFYDLLSFGFGYGRSKYISAKKVMKYIPTSVEKGLKGGVVYHDGQFDDSRMAINLAQTCVENGGTVVNEATVTGILHNEAGKVAGVKFVDNTTGEEYSIKARSVVNAAGCFVDDIMHMDSPEHRKMVTPSQGVHLVLDMKFLQSDYAIMVPKTSDGRVLFAVPWHDKVVVGTTDIVRPTPEEEPRPLKEEIDFILGTDPDSDRVGIMVRNKQGEFEPVTGNQTGVLLLDYLIGAMKRAGKLPANAAALKTIVTTEMARAVAEANGLDCYDTFTGFKFMAEKMNELEGAGKNTVIFSYEESYGYMLGDYVRDKDAVTASLLLTEMAAWYHAQGMTLFDALNALFEKYGWYGEKTHNLVMPGLDGLEKMAALMQSLRAQPPVEIGGVTVAQYKDYSDGTVRDAATGAITPMPLSGSNVLRFELTDGSHIVVRPSGTEPKIKVYILTKGADAAERDANLEKYSAWVKTLA